MLTPPVPPSITYYPLRVSCKMLPDGPSDWSTWTETCRKYTSKKAHEEKEIHECRWSTSCLHFKILINGSIQRTFVTLRGMSWVSSSDALSAVSYSSHMTHDFSRVHSGNMQPPLRIWYRYKWTVLYLSLDRRSITSTISVVFFYSSGPTPQISIYCTGSCSSIWNEDWAGYRVSTHCISIFGEKSCDIKISMNHNLIELLRSTHTQREVYLFLRNLAVHRATYQRWTDNFVCWRKMVRTEVLKFRKYSVTFDKKVLFVPWSTLFACLYLPCVYSFT